jgi:uncharacterized protein
MHRLAIILSRLRIAMAHLLLFAAFVLVPWMVMESPHFWRMARGEPERERLLMIASINGDLVGVRRALDEGAPPDTTDTGLTSLMLAKDAAVARYLISRGADVHLLVNHATPLNQAALRGNLEIMRILLDAGADPNQPVPDECDALTMARRAGHHDVEEILIQWGAKPLP